MDEARESWEVPAYDVVEFVPRRSRYCVCIPVLNEGERIGRQFERMRSLTNDIDIVVADGGSTDGAVDPPRISGVGLRALLTKTGPGKLSAQMRMAIAWTMEQGYEGVVFIDGNDKDDPAEIPVFLRVLDEGYDHVQGSRFLPGGHHENTPWLRLAGIKLLHAPLISLAAGFRYTDTTNGFRAYSRRLLLDPRVAPLRAIFSAYELHYYLAIRAARLGYRCLELPVTRVYPADGAVPTKVTSIRGNLLLLRTLLRACLHRFDPKPSAAATENPARG